MATNGIDIMLVVASENIALIPRNACWKLIPKIPLRLSFSIQRYFEGLEEPTCSPYSPYTPLQSVMLTFCGGGIEWDSNDEMLSMVIDCINLLRSRSGILIFSHNTFSTSSSSSVMFCCSTLLLSNFLYLKAQISVKVLHILMSTE